MAKVIDKTDEIIIGIHNATGARGEELKAMYFIYASMFCSFIGDKEKEEHFDKRIANMKLQ